MAEHYGGDDGGGYGDVDGKWRRLGLMQMTAVNMAMCGVVRCSSGVGPFIKVVQVDQMVWLVVHTTIHMSGDGHMEHRLLLWFLCCDSHLMSSISTLLLTMYWLDFVHK
jgi:hypothetical protein